MVVLKLLALKLQPRTNSLEITSPFQRNYG